MKAIITVIGKDKSGIIASISGLLAKECVNIEDISQTIVQGNFTMIMLCGMENAKSGIKELGEMLNSLGEEIGVSIRIQHEDIFNVMHKI